MRIAVFLLTVLWMSGVAAEQCYPEFSESDLIASVGKKPLKKKIKKEDGITRHQYEFRKELSADEALSDDPDIKYEPQFYLVIYDPPCASKVTIFFYRDNEYTANLSNITLAGRAFKYLAGVKSAIFENKMNRFKSVRNFESFDNKADSKFINTGDMYTINVILK